MLKYLEQTQIYKCMLAQVEFQVEEHENENFANENDEVERGDSSELD